MAITETEHEFDFSILLSRVLKGADSLGLSYRAYQITLSLWWEMRDELRILRGFDRKKDSEILIGFGSMSWSGGHLNSAPFCLIKVIMIFRFFPTYWNRNIT